MARPIVTVNTSVVLLPTPQTADSAEINAALVRYANLVCVRQAQARPIVTEHPQTHLPARQTAGSVVLHVLTANLVLTVAAP